MNTGRMLEGMAKDYSNYLKLDISNGFNIVQDVVDNLLTRLEELTSILQIIKLKNSDCSTSVSEDISKHRSEINMLSKKISVLSNVIQTLQNNVVLLENEIEKAEIHFGLDNENKIKSFLRPFLKMNKDIIIANVVTPQEKIQLQSTMSNFKETWYFTKTRKTHIVSV